MLLEKLASMNVVLASASPRRQDLLRKMGIEFISISLDVDEDSDGYSKPEDLALELSMRKASAVPDEFRTGNAIVITADTVVAIGDRVLGKPADRAEAISMLMALSGQRHTVITAVSLVRGDRMHSFASSSTVGFTELSREEIEYYVDNYRPFDKAGSYGIQEWIGFIGIDFLEGSYFNVMGLPTQRLYRELERFLSAR